MRKNILILILVVLLSVVGCADPSCESPEYCQIGMIYIPPTVDAGMNPERFGDGASCDVDEQCENNKCISSKNSFGSGICFSLGMTGCIAVTEPSPVYDLCPAPLKKLFTCGTSSVESLGKDCADIATGDVGEHYYCCTGM